MKTLKVLLQEVVSGIKAWVNSNFAQESNAVHKTGNETVNGDKTLTGTTTFSGNVACDQNCQFTKRVNLSEITGTSDCSIALNALSNVVFFNTRGSSNYQSYGTFLYAGYESGNEAPYRYGQLFLLRSTDKRGETNDGFIPDTTFKMWRVSPSYYNMEFMESVRIQNIGSTNKMIPISNNVTDLGISTNKWKSFNGLNPGALSLPNLNYTDTKQWIDISGNVTDETGGENEYDPAVDGWVVIYAKNNPTSLRVNVHAPRPSIKKYLSSATGVAIDGTMIVSVPAPAGSRVYIYFNKGSGSLDAATFITCQGNV